MIDRHKFDSFKNLQHLLFLRHDNKLEDINVSNNKHTINTIHFVERYLFKNM